MSDTDISTAAVERLLDGVSKGPWRAVIPAILGDRDRLAAENASLRKAFIGTKRRRDNWKAAAEAAEASADLIAQDRDRLAAEVARLSDRLNSEMKLYAEWRGRSEAAEAEVARLREAAKALGALPDGYCFCSSNRVGDDSKIHEPECSDLRNVINGAENA